MGQINGSEEIAYEQIARGAFSAFTRSIQRFFPGLGGERREIVMTGGGALLTSLVGAVREAYGAKVSVPEVPQATAALGAAIIAKMKFLAA